MNFTKTIKNINYYQLIKPQNLRKTWSEQHFRVQDFKQKKLLKYPQIFYFSMGLFYDPETNIIDQKTITLTKYTVNKYYKFLKT